LGSRQAIAAPAPERIRYALEGVEVGTSIPIRRCRIEGAANGIDPAQREGIMATKEHGRIVETPTEARQAEPGPSVLALLAISTGLAILILGVIWFVFFRT
jgi:hypothetical protein